MFFFKLCRFYFFLDDHLNELFWAIDKYLLLAIDNNSVLFIFNLSPFRQLT
jgi:hypothetical protein